MRYPILRFRASLRSSARPVARPFLTATTSLAALVLAPAVAAADVPNVVTDLPPVHSLAAMVMGDLGAPVLLLDRGANAHSFQLRPSQARSLSQADVVIWTGEGMSPWMARALTATSGDARMLALLEHNGTLLRDFGAPNDEHGHEDAAHDDHDEHGHDDHGHDHHGHDDHDHSGTDPHAWLDPRNAAIWLDVIAAELSAADPDNAATYAANAVSARDSIASLEATLSGILAPVTDRPFVVFHDAYGYFANRFDLDVAGSVSLGDAASPGAARLADLQSRLAEEGVVCAFPEAQHDPALLQVVIEGTDVRLGGTLDPSGSTLEPGAALYPALLTGMAETMRDCLAEG